MKSLENIFSCFGLRVGRPTMAIDFGLNRSFSWAINSCLFSIYDIRPAQICLSNEKFEEELILLIIKRVSIDKFVKSQKAPVLVIPVKTGIQENQPLMNSRFRGSDGLGDFLRDHQY